ncbi:alpha-L-glutamate ligase [Kineococcus sp. T13]|uniref:ATP-grasp domain-containing protein n=1 Tax=Kineococcus vitellinus TaxID=2696565 RepID=UPI001411B48F|nr:alpha-L-glutamate ligase [Kineococcus vitellinus]
MLSGVSTPAVHVLHENPEWMPPFAAAFAAEGVPLVEHVLTGGVLDLAEQPAPGVWWSRMSASSHTRGHLASSAHTRALLSWLEAAGRRTVNGRAVLELELSKVAQLTALAAAGIDVPRTVAVVGGAGEQLVAAAREFATGLGDGFVTKHSQGGKGLGVARFETVAELERAVADGQLEEPVDGVWLLQEYVRPADASITRAEFVGGEFLYAVRADTAKGGFQLCPADACAIDPATGRPVLPPGATVQQEVGDTIFSLREGFEHPVLRRFEGFLRTAGVEVAGVEFIESADGRLVTYDVNTNTNYNAAVDAAAPRSGPREIARYLGRLLAEQG